MKIITKIKSNVKDYGCVIFASLLVYGLFQLGLYFRDTSHTFIFGIVSGLICGFLGASAWMSWEDRKTLKEFIAEDNKAQEYVQNRIARIIKEIKAEDQEDGKKKEASDIAVAPSDEVLVDADFDEVEDREDYLSAKAVLDKKNPSVPLEEVIENLESEENKDENQKLLEKAIEQKNRRTARDEFVGAKSTEPLTTEEQREKLRRISRTIRSEEEEDE